MCRCIFELWRAITLKRPIRLGLPKSEAVRFTKAVYDDFEANVVSIVETKVDVLKAQATEDADREMILGQIRGSVGVQSFNDVLRSKLMAYFVHCAIQHRQVNSFRQNSLREILA